MRTMSARKFTASIFTSVGIGAYVLCFLPYANAQSPVPGHDPAAKARSENATTEETVTDKYHFNEKAGFPFCDDLLKKDTELNLAKSVPQRVIEQLLKTKMEERSKEFEAMRNFEEFFDRYAKGETIKDPLPPPPPEPVYERRTYFQGNSYGGSGGCFAPETKVTILKDGLKKSVDIQIVDAGDFVLASTEVYNFNEGLGKTCWAKITKSHEFKAHEKRKVPDATESRHAVFHKVNVIDGNGNSLDLTVTPNHPFFVAPSADKKNVSELRRTADLKVGDRLIHSNGTELFVKSVGEGKSAPTCGIDSMFDLQVEGVHNYFVGDTLPVLVHNK